jgi:hypothetical protein
VCAHLSRVFSLGEICYTRFELQLKYILSEVLEIVPPKHRIAFTRLQYLHSLSHSGPDTGHNGPI